MKKISFPQVGDELDGTAPRLTRYAWLSIAAAILTIGLKFGAYLVTGSVGLLSDAAESVVNLVAAVVVLLTGFRLVSQSMNSLLDAALPTADLDRVMTVLDRSRTAEVEFADLRTRESGRHRFVSLTVLVPGAWTVERGHDIATQIEVAIRKSLPDCTVQTHIEPRRTS